MFYGYLLDSIGLESTLLVFVLANLLLPITLVVNPALRHLKPPVRLEAAESVQG
jgi:hypothetical protein